MTRNRGIRILDVSGRSTDRELVIDLNLLLAEAKPLLRRTEKGLDFSKLALVHYSDNFLTFTYSLGTKDNAMSSSERTLLVVIDLESMKVLKMSVSTPAYAYLRNTSHALHYYKQISNTRGKFVSYDIKTGERYSSRVDLSREQVPNPSKSHSREVCVGIFGEYYYGVFGFRHSLENKASYYFGMRFPLAFPERKEYTCIWRSRWEGKTIHSPPPRLLNKHMIKLELDEETGKIMILEEDAEGYPKHPRIFRRTELRFPAEAGLADPSASRPAFILWSGFGYLHGPQGRRMLDPALIMPRQPVTVHSIDDDENQYRCHYDRKSDTAERLYPHHTYHSATKTCIGIVDDFAHSAPGHLRHMRIRAVTKNHQDATGNTEHSFSLAVCKAMIPYMCPCGRSTCKRPRDLGCFNGSNSEVEPVMSNADSHVLVCAPSMQVKIDLAPRPLILLSFDPSVEFGGLPPAESADTSPNGGGSTSWLGGSTLAAKKETMPPLRTFQKKWVREETSQWRNINQGFSYFPSRSK